MVDINKIVKDLINDNKESLIELIRNVEITSFAIVPEVIDECFREKQIIGGELKIDFLIKPKNNT